MTTPVPRGDVRRRNRDDAGGRVGGRQEADVAGGVRGAGLQELLLPAAHRDLQAPPGGEGGEVQQEQLGAAARVPGSNQRGDGAGGSNMNNQPELCRFWTAAMNTVYTNIYGPTRWGGNIRRQVHGTNCRYNSIH